MCRNATMNAETGSERHGEEILIVGLNWLGDSIMSMPAIQAFRRAHPGSSLAMLARPPVAGLWKLSPAIDETIVCPGSLAAIVRTAAAIRGRFTAAYVLPGSFRAGLVPFLAGIPRRIGRRGHWRPWLISEIALRPAGEGASHQALEYASVFGIELPPGAVPEIIIKPDLAAAAEKLLPDKKKPWIGLMPGAARGPSKCWPEDYFAASGSLMARDFNCHIALFGSPADREICARIGDVIGTGAVNLAGRTSLPELAALMQRCSVVIGNDSGGAHLASAAGAAVIVIFGITSPGKTRPLGARVLVLQNSASSARDIPRRSELAAGALRNITPEMVVNAAGKIIGGC